MATIAKTLGHTYQVIVGINALIQMKTVLFRSPVEVEIMEDILPTDLQKRTAYMINLYKYARLKLDLKEGMTLKVIDMEFGSEIANIHLGKVSFSAK